MTQGITGVKTARGNWNFGQVSFFGFGLTRVVQKNHEFQELDRIGVFFGWLSWCVLFLPLKGQKFIGLENQASSNI